MAGTTPTDTNNKATEMGNEELSYEINVGGKPDASFDMPVEDTVEIENPISSVASAPAKNVFILGILAVLAVLFLYKMFFQESEEVTAKKELKAQMEAQPTEAAKEPTKQDEKPKINIGVVDTPELPAVEVTQQLPLPVLPEEPKTEAPLPPPPAPSLEPVKLAPDPIRPSEPVLAPVNTPAANQAVAEPAPAPAPATVAGEQQQPAAPTGPTEEQIYAKEMARRKTGMLVMNGGGTPKDVSEGKSDPSAVEKSGASTVIATKVEDLSIMILQGKMIEAVLETTINTDLPGSLRAVVSRDVYAEAGSNILIPKGSRLLGTYGSGVTPGQQRVAVSWGRVIRPDGVDIDIQSTGTDQLGRSGMTGIIDNKYYEMFGNSLLTTILTVGGAIALSGTEKTITTTTSTGGTSGSAGETTTQSSTPTDAAVLQGVQNLGDIAKNIAKGQSTTPTIIVNQGSRIRVFVNKDLIFPKSIAGKYKIENTD